MPRLDLVGVDEIAERLGVSRSAVSQWIARGWPGGGAGRPHADAKRPKSPKLIATISGRIAVYNWPDVERWARETGRLP